MIRALPLFRSPLVCIERCDHPPDVPHVDPDEERSSAYCISFVERGTFSVIAEDREWTVGASELFVTVPGLVYRCDHHNNPDDVCFCVGFGPDVGEGALNLRGLNRRAPVAPLTNRRGYLQQRLTQRVEDHADPLAIESIAGELLQDTVDGVGSTRLYARAQLAWYARRVNAARDELDADYASPHSLTSLARTAGMSPFHFARIFGELTAVPPHRYLIAVRLRAAIERLRQGESVTDTCFAVGFNSLGHFIEMFRRTYGVSPSRFH
jgi:AraC family transcriptional regulator